MYCLKPPMQKPPEGKLRTKIHVKQINKFFNIRSILIILILEE